MSSEQEDHLKKIQSTLHQLVGAKYRRGQAEHGGNLWERNISNDLVDEAVDQVVYTLTQREKQRTATVKMVDALQHLLVVNEQSVAAARLAIHDAMVALNGQPTD